MNVIQNIAIFIDTLRRNGGNHAPSSDALDYIVANYLPFGSGVDNGCTIDFDRQKPGKIVIGCDFHHMDGSGYYNGWTTHEIILTPSFDHWPNIRVTGRNRNDIKEYLADLFHYALDVNIEKRWDIESQSWEFTRS